MEGELNIYCEEASRCMHWLCQAIAFFQAKGVRLVVWFNCSGTLKIVAVGVKGGNPSQCRCVKKAREGHARQEKCCALRAFHAHPTTHNVSLHLSSFAHAPYT